MKTRYTRLHFRQLPRHVQEEVAVSLFVRPWVRGWKRFVSGDYGYIMNRRDEWYQAKYG